MNKIFIITVFFYFSFFCMPLAAQSLDEVILAAAVKIGRDLPANSKAAIVNFSSSSEKLSKYVIEELQGYLLRNQRVLPVIPDQSQLGSIQSNLNFSPSGEVTVESVRFIKELLGVSHVITGSIDNSAGAEYIFLLNTADAQNAEIKSIHTAALDLRNDQLLPLLLGIVVKKSGQRAAQESIIDPNKFIFGVNAHIIGLGLEFGKGNFSTEIDIFFPIAGFGEKFGILAAANYFWHSRIGGAYLGGGIRYVEFDYTELGLDELNGSDFSLGINGGYKFVTRIGIYFRVGAYVGFYVADVADILLDSRLIASIGWTMK